MKYTDVRIALAKRRNRAFLSNSLSAVSLSVCQSSNARNTYRPPAGNRSD